MFPSFIITFREVLEMALIVGIVLSYLIKIKQTRFNNVIYVGVGAGIVASLIGAYVFQTFAGGFEGQAEELFEGITMLIGAALLTTMIFWMMKQQNIARHLEEKVNFKLKHSARYGLFALIFVAILREGIETVIFLSAADMVSGQNGLLGALLGMAAAIGLGYLIFVGAKKISLQKFFTVTNILLILFAAGLVAHGIHELQETKVIPMIAEHVWDINPAVAVEGVYPLMHEKGTVGSIFKSLFGYNGNPSLIEVIGYLSYLLVIGLIWGNISRQKAK
jgi:high-affinity iron transporter